MIITATAIIKACDAMMRMKVGLLSKHNREIEVSKNSDIFYMKLYFYKKTLGRILKD